MKLTIIQVGQTPPALQHKFERYPKQFQSMFAKAGAGFEFESVMVLDDEPLPDPKGLQGAIITGSAAGVYDDYHWMEPLRDFIRDAYAHRTPLLGVCFGHQIMADALGGDVRKSEKGWALGRNVYEVKAKPAFLDDLPDTLAIAASHQDQVIEPPEEAEVFLGSAFTPNAGLVYRNGAAMSVQPHPEFDVDFARALIDIRRGNPLNDDEADVVSQTFDAPLDSACFAKSLTRFFNSAR